MAAPLQACYTACAPALPRRSSATSTAFTTTPASSDWHSDTYPPYRRRVRRRSVRVFRTYRQPSLWNTLRFHIRSIPLIVTLTKLDMRTSTSRRNIVIPTVTTLTGDIAIAMAIAGAIIEAIALG